MTENYHHGDLRNALINGGLRMLTRDGIASFSMRKLSNELGVSHAAAYRHFASKEDLLREILRESSKRFNDALFSAASDSVETREDLLRIGVAYVLFFVRNPEILTLMNLHPSAEAVLSNLFIKTPAADNNPIACTNHYWTDTNEAADSCSFTVLHHIAKVLKKYEPFKKLSDREIMLGFWGKMHGIASVLVTQKHLIPEDEIEKAVERVVRTPF